MDQCRFPDTTTVRMVAVEELAHQNTRLALECWQALRKGRTFPTREDIGPRTIAPFMKNLSIVKVIDDGADFENRIIGDAVAQAYNAKMNASLISEVERNAPLLGSKLREVYRHALRIRQPFAVKATVGHDKIEARFAETEVVVLPLGNMDTIDHILTVSAFVYV